MPSSKTFFYAKNLSDVFYQMKNISELNIVGGCTSFVGKELPEKALSVRDIAELKVIDKHERYIDLGSALSLSEIEDLGEANLPKIFYEAITTIANRNIRNIATVGGNVCGRDFYNTLYAPLLVNELSASFAFLAKSQKNQISDLRIAFAGSFKFRDIDLENKLIGAHLPLSATAISNFMLEAEDFFNQATSDRKLNPILRHQFWNLVKYSLEQLT